MSNTLKGDEIQIMTVDKQNKGLTTVRMGAHVLYMCNDHTVQYSRRICM